MSDRVVFRLTSPLNISFDHAEESEHTREEWADMSDKERTDALNEHLWANVEVYAENE